MLTAFTFPGQGAQRPGMLGMLPGDADSLARIRQAEAILDQPLNTLDTREAFKDTRNVQLALLISGFIWAEYLTRNEVEPDYVLGLSIGAYPAAIIAGCISFEDALRLEGKADAGGVSIRLWDAGLNGASTDNRRASRCPAVREGTACLPRQPEQRTTVCFIRRAWGTGGNR